MSRLDEVRLDVPATLNHKSVHALRHAVADAMHDAASSVVVIQGSPQIFCRGLDFDELVETSSDEQTLALAIEEYCACLSALRFSSKPTVALVQGATLGGGVGLVAACDVVIATQNASFALPEVLFGFAPAMVLPFLLERVSRQAARIWALTAATRSAEQAQTEGLVDRVVADFELDSELRRWVKQLRRGQRRGVGIVKQLTSTLPSFDQLAALKEGQESTLAALRDSGVVLALTRFKNDGILPWEAI